MGYSARDTGLIDKGAGKGDTERPGNWRSKYDEINWKGSPRNALKGFTEVSPKRVRKNYGKL